MSGAAAAQHISDPRLLSDAAGMPPSVQTTSSARSIATRTTQGDGSAGPQRPPSVSYARNPGDVAAVSLSRGTRTGNCTQRRWRSRAPPAVTIHTESAYPQSFQNSQSQFQNPFNQDPQAQFQWQQMSAAATAGQPPGSAPQSVSAGTAPQFLQPPVLNFLSPFSSVPGGTAAQFAAPLQPATTLSAIAPA